MNTQTIRKLDFKPAYNPFVSVIIPNYNHAQFLKERIDSVLNQSYQNFEVIFLDDCSTDNSKEIIESYKNDKRIIAREFNIVNSGNTFIQWEKGLSVAKGELVWIAESDDVAEPDFLKKMISMFEKDHSIGMGFCSSLIIDEQGKKSNYYHSETYPDNTKNIYSQDFILIGQEFVTKELIKYNNIPNASAVVFKKELFVNINDFKLCGDWFLWLKILKNNSIFYIKTPMNKFRIHSTSVRKNTSNKEFVREYIKLSRVLITNYSLTTQSIKLLYDSIIYRCKYELLNNFSLKLLLYLVIYKIRIIKHD